MALTQITEKGIKDGELVNADVNASAAIAKSKLASLDIVNADVNASAAIAGSKLAAASGSAAGSMSAAHYTKVEGIAASANNYTHPNHSGDVTSSADGATTIADNAVTLAKMAGGTDGQIITYDASGDPIAVGPGTDGQVLTSTGAGSPPAFEDASGTTINNNADNRIITGSGTAGTLNGESGLTFDGSTMNFTAASGDARLTLIGTEGNDARITLTADDGDDHIDQWNIRSEAANHFAIDQFASGSFVERLTIASDASNGDVTVKTGDLIFGTAGKGICLGVTSNTAANTLDDYEEGTWVIAATAESGTVTLHTNVNEGHYVKIGRLVHVSVRVNISAVSGQSGYLRLSLPFATSNTGPDQSWASIFPLYTTHINLPNDAISTMGEPWHNTAYVNFMVQYDDGLWTAVNCNALDAGGSEYISFTTTYITDS